MSPFLSKTWKYFQGYEYFGYDPATYFSSDADENSFNQDSSFINEDGHGTMSITDESQEGRESRGERQEQPVLEIDLDQVEDGCGKNVRRSEQNQILCKWDSDLIEAFLGHTLTWKKWEK